MNIQFVHMRWSSPAGIGALLQPAYWSLDQAETTRLGQGLVLIEKENKRAGHFIVTVMVSESPIHAFGTK